MPKRVFIIHGWEGSPDSNWFPWLKKELEEKSSKVFVPQMPNADQPKINEWLAHLREIVGRPGENTYFVGHSLGVTAILRYLESLEAEEKISGAILVAGVAKSIGIKELENFFINPFDYEKIIGDKFKLGSKVVIGVIIAIILIILFPNSIHQNIFTNCNYISMYIKIISINNI